LTALFYPISVFVWVEDFPIDIIERGAINNRKFFVCTEVVANIAVVDTDIVRDFALDGNDDRDSCASAVTEDVACFLSSNVACSTSITAKVVHVNVAEFIFKRQPDAIRSVSGYPTAVRHEGHDAVCAEAVNRPTKGPQIGVVQRVLKLST